MADRHRDMNNFIVVSKSEQMMDIEWYSKRGGHQSKQFIFSWIFKPIFVQSFQEILSEKRSNNVRKHPVMCQYYPDMIIKCLSTSRLKFFNIPWHKLWIFTIFFWRSQASFRFITRKSKTNFCSREEIEEKIAWKVWYSSRFKKNHPVIY